MCLGEVTLAIGSISSKIEDLTSSRNYSRIIIFFN